MTLDGATEAGASQSTGSCVGNSAGPEAVFEYFSLTDGAVCASTNGSDFDTVLYVREGQCGADAAELECNDDSGLMLHYDHSRTFNSSRNSAHATLLSTAMMPMILVT